MKLYRAFATVGGWTGASRVLGFVREMLMAAVVGTGPVADAFIVAFRLPNLFRRLFGEGAFNSAFVPLFAKRLEGEGADAARRFSDEAFSGLLLVTLIVTAIAMMAMPWLTLGLAPGFGADQTKLDLAVVLSRITFPYLACMSLVALLSGLLNSLKKFAAAAAAPVLLNVVLISVLALALALGWQRTGNAGLILAWGVCVSGLLQLGLLLWAAARQGYAPRLMRPRLTDDMRRLVRLGVPGVISGGVTQINIVIGTMIASTQAAAVSYLYYADRLYQLPLGIVGVAIGVVLLPDLARRLKAGDLTGAADSQNRSFEFALLLTLPAAVALAIVPFPIIQVLFERGAFTAADTAETASALAAFAIGLPSFVLVKVFSPGYFAREDTRTPMLFGIAAVAANVLLSLLLFPMLAHVGVALATSIAGWLNAALLWLGLMRRGEIKADARLWRTVPLLIAASAAMGVVLWLLAGALAAFFPPSNGPLVQAGALGLLVVGGGVVFALLCELSGAARLRQIMGGLRRK
jgi:putative peptidoglycan lipid II flippase